MEIKLGVFTWKQVDGDINPGTYGGTIAQSDGTRIDFLKIQPVRDYVGDAEAIEVGFPFWTKEATFDVSDLDPTSENVREALNYVGITDNQLDEFEPEIAAVAIGCALLDYGFGNEGIGGWARDILGSRRVQWNGSTRPRGWRFLAGDDQEFRRLLSERKAQG